MDHFYIYTTNKARKSYGKFLPWANKSVVAAEVGKVEAYIPQESQGT